MTTTANGRGTIRLNVDVSPELDALLDRMADQSRSTRSEVLTRALALMSVALEAQATGKTIGVADKGSRTIEKEITGLTATS